MRWDFVIPAWLERLTDDAQLMQLLKGPHIYPKSASRPVRIPSVEYRPVTDIETENFNPITVQVDIWAPGERLGGLIEKRIRLLTHKDVGQDLAGERLWLQFLEASTADFPSEPGVMHRIVDFLFTPLRGHIAA